MTFTFLLSLVIKTLFIQISEIGSPQIFSRIEIVQELLVTCFEGFFLEGLAPKSEFCWFLI